MPDAPSGGADTHPPAHGKKKNDFLTKYKWPLIAGLAAIAVLTFYFVRKSTSAASSAGSTTPGTGVAAGVDPNTGVPYATEYGYGASGGGGTVGGGNGATGATGATGPAGPAGPKGATGAVGKPAAPALKTSTNPPITKGSYYSAVYGKNLTASQWHQAHLAHLAHLQKVQNAKIALWLASSGHRVKPLRSWFRAGLYSRLSPLCVPRRRLRKSTRTAARKHS